MKRDRKEKFSIRKFSFGAASCLIGAQIAISGVTNTAKADGITAYEANGDKVTAYAHGESVYKLRGTSTSIYNAFWMDVDTSKYTKENPIIKVTLTYNAKDNQTGNAPIFWSGRPMHWFTVPEATEELGRDYKLSLTNGSGNTTEFSDWRSWESNSRFIHSKYKGNPDAWERYNTTTTEMLRKTPFVSLNSEFNKVLGDNNNRWYDNSNMPTQDIMRDLRAKSNSIYIDWEKRAAGTVTVSYTTKVKDPEKTKEITIGMGVYQPSNAQQYARVETIKLPVLYKLNEVFEPKEPERTAVGDITNLKDAEIAIIREKIWAANLNNTSTLLSTNNAFKDNLKDSSNSGANSIVIDRTTGKATIIYKDDTTDTIEGSNLIYKKPEPPKPVTPSTPTTDTVAADGLVTHSGLSFYTNPLEVDDLNKITPSQRNDARERFKKANLTSDGLSEYATYEGVSKSNLKAKVNFKIPDGPRNRASINFRGNGENFITLTNIKGGGILGTVPKEYLFKEKAKPAFDINAAKEEANKLIESLDNLYPNEKLGYKAIIANATDRDSIEIEVNKAKAKANENAIKLAEMKKEANDKINGLNYLTKEERENAINKINSATIKQGDNNVDSAATNDKRDIDANRDDTRDRLNSVVNELVQQNLQKARQKAIETINSIPNEDLSSDKKTDYINKINAASKIGPASEEGTILNIVEKAQKEASAKEAARKKEEADKVRQQYKDMIANIPGLTDEEKTEYNKAIDAANNVGEMESIVEYAKLSGERKKAIEALRDLNYLNNAQKQAFTDAINGSATKAELDYYVSQATQLNSKMKQLHDLAAEARKIKPENGAPQDKYTSAAAEKQTAFNNALADAERVLNKATGADEAITSVGKLFTALETAINELKPSEKVTIPADKSALKAEYDKGDSVKKSPAYTKETNPDKKNAYDNALKEAKKVLDATNATQDAVDKALEDLEVAKAGLNGKQEEFALTKTDENAVAISIEPVKGEIVSKKEDKDLILGKIDGIPTGATVIYNPIVEKANKKYVPVKVTHENVSKEIEIEVIKDEVLNKPTTKVKVNNTNKLTEKEKEAVKTAVKQANPTLDENSITVNENGGVTVTYQTRPPKTIAASDTVEAGIASKVIPVVSTAKLSEVPKENGTITKEAHVQKVKDAVTVTVPTDQPQDVTKELVDGGKVVQGTNQSADGGADNTDKLVVKVKVTYKDGSEDVVEVPVEGDTAAKTTPEVSTAKLSEVPKENGTITKEADVQKVKDAVKLPEVPKDQPQPTKELVDGGKVVQGTDQSGNGGANNTGKLVVKVEVTYPDGSKETVEVPVEGDTAAKTTPEVSIAKLSEVPKENGTITKEADVQKVKDAVKLPEVPKDQPQPTKELVDGGKVVQGTDQSGNGGANNTGKPVVKVEVTYADGSKDVVEVPVEGTDATKATPKVKEEITSGEVPVSVDPAKDKKVVEADKKAITDAVVVPEGQPQPTDKQVKNDGVIVDGTGANTGKKVVVVEVTYPDGSKDEIEVPVRKITDKEKAKSDLTDAANTEKGEIGGDTTLTDKEKEALKAKVDEVKKAAEDKIDKAKTSEEIAKATEEGKKAIADVYKPQTSKGKSTSIFKSELDLQTALVSGKATVEKGKDLTDEEILKQLALTDGVTAKITSKPTTTETGTKEAEVEVTLADGTKVTVKVPVEVVESLEKADKDNDLAKAKEDAKKQVEEAAKKKLDEIKKDKDLTEDQKQKAEEAITKAKDDANKAIDEASSAGTVKQIADEAKGNIEKYNPKADTEVKKPDVTNLDEEKAKAKAEVLEEAQKRINEIKNNKDVSDEEKQKAINAINKAKDKAIEDINKGQSKDKIDAAKDNGIKKINEVQPEGSIASKFEPKVPENKVEVKNPTKLSDEEREKVRQNIEGVNTFPDGTTVDVKADGTAVITYKDGSSDNISKDKLVAPAKKDEGTIASRIEPVIPGKTQVGNTTKLTPEEQAAVKKAVEEANNFPAGTTVEVRPDGTVVITYPDKSVDTITGDKLVEKSTKQTTPKAKTEAEKNPAQVPGVTQVENPTKLTPSEQSAVAVKVKAVNPAATVTVSKDGTATLTYSDGSVNTIPGTSLVAQGPGKQTVTQAVQNPAKVPAVTEVGNAHNLTSEEQSAVAVKVKQANPEATVTVSKDGTATLTYSDGSVNTIPGTRLVVQKEEVPTQDKPTIAEETKVIIPANPTKVAEATRLTDEEKEAVRKAVVEANRFGSDVKVEVAGDGTATIVFKDGSAITIPGTRLVVQDPKAQDSNKTDAEKTTVKAPAQRVEVKDITHLTDEEKEAVRKAVVEANGFGSDVKVEVAGDGTATITFPDGSVATILGKDTVQQSAKTEPAIEEKPEYTPGQDNGGNTGRLDDRENAGSNNASSEENTKGGIQEALAHTGLDNASGLGLSGLGLAMLGGLLAARRRKEK